MRNNADFMNGEGVEGEALNEGTASGDRVAGCSDASSRCPESKLDFQGDRIRAGFSAE